MNNVSKHKKAVEAIRILSIIALAVVLAGIAFYGVGHRSEELTCEKYYNTPADDYKTLFRISDSKTLCFDKKAYEIFENACLGNSNTNLIFYGNYCSRDAKTCISSANTVLTADGSEIEISKASSSYINIINGSVYYRNDTDKKIYCYSIQNSSNSVVVDKACGETIVSQNGIAYIDLNTSQLNFYAFKNKKSQKVYDKKIRSFAVIGSSYWCLTENKKFGILTGGGKFRTITSNVDRFLCDGKVMIQKGSNIYEIDKGYKTTLVLQNVKSELIGFKDDSLYFIENGALRSYDTLKSKYAPDIKRFESTDVLKALYITDKDYQIAVCKTNNEPFKTEYEIIAK